MVRSIGANHVVDYTQEDFAERGQAYDLILDVGGNSSLAHLRRALAPRGTLVIVGGETDGRWLGVIPRPGNTSGGSPSPNGRYGRQVRRAASPAYSLLAFRIRLGA